MRFFKKYTSNLLQAIAASAVPSCAAAMGPLRPVRDVAAARAVLVDVSRVDPGLAVDLRYAGADNVFGRAFYISRKAYLTKDAARRLALANAKLYDYGVRLKIWDAYRPHSVQRAMWEHLPDERYVADPAKGSRHNRGAAVDVTLIHLDGRELEMPTLFDEFNERASAGAEGVPPEAARHAALLASVMVESGFAPLRTEWWHFDAVGWEELDILDVEGALLE